MNDKINYTPREIKMSRMVGNLLREMVSHIYIRKGCVLAFFSVVASYSNLSTLIFGHKGNTL